MADQGSGQEFGSEIKFLSDIIEKGKSAGADISFWKLLADYPELFQDLIKFSKTKGSVGCDQDPFGDMIDYDNIVYHRKHHNFPWKANYYKLELLELKANMTDKELFDYIELKYMANLNLYNWLRDNQEAIPEEWWTKQVCFLGTVCCDARQSKDLDHYGVMVIRHSSFYGRKDSEWMFGRQTIANIINAGIPYYGIRIL